MVSTKRPSRGDVPSATTTRKWGCFFRPMRRSRILTGILVRIQENRRREAYKADSGLSRGRRPARSGSEGEAFHAAHHPAHLLHERLHLLELLQEAIHLRDRSSAPLG